MARSVALVLSLALLTAAATAGAALAGWEHLGTGSSPTTPALNGAVRALNADLPGRLLVGGSFTDAGGDANADHIASWDGTRWSALGTVPFNGDVSAIAVSGNRIFAGGNFTDAGGDPNADGLAAWNGTSWSAPCGAGGYGSGGLSLQNVRPNLFLRGGLGDAGRKPAPHSPARGRPD